MLHDKDIDGYGDKGDSEGSDLQEPFKRVSEPLTLTKDDVDRGLLEYFRGIYGTEGELIIFNPSINSILSGGKNNHTNSPGAYPGFHFSYSLSLYMARVSCGLASSSREAYELFLEDAQYYFRKFDSAKKEPEGEIKHFPSKEFIERISREALERLEKLEHSGPDDHLRCTA
ncbi:MAG: hypothetical protein GC137_02555 [Alphaproteobacteria bacterium]|nr:hypothetical protein [Alphaproteobacteria bacterium]